MCLALKNLYFSPQRLSAAVSPAGGRWIDGAAPPCPVSTWLSCVLAPFCDSAVCGLRLGGWTSGIGSPVTPTNGGAFTSTGGPKSGLPSAPRNGRKVLPGVVGFLARILSPRSTGPLAAGGEDCLASSALTGALWNFGGIRRGWGQISCRPLVSFRKSSLGSGFLVVSIAGPAKSNGQ